MSIWARLAAVFGFLDGRTVEIVFLFLTFGWGAWIVMPWDTFHTSPSYKVLSFIAPEWLWGATALLIGTCRINGLVFDNYPLRIFAAGAGCGIWWTTWVGIAWYEWRSIGVPVYFVLSSFCAYSLWELIRQYRQIRRSLGKSGGGAALAGIPH